MPVKSLKRLLKQTLAPVALVIAFWIAMSGATTYYLLWIERSNHRVFVENVSAIRAAEALQIAIWRIAAEYPVDVHQVRVFRLRWNDTRVKIANERQKLVDSASADEERLELAKMEASLNEFIDNINVLFDRTIDANTSALRAAIP